MVIYLCGPMTGLPDFNFPAFHAAAKRLRDSGHTIYNPAENFGGRTDILMEKYMLVDTVHICNAEAIALLPGWQQSKHAQLEIAIAIATGLPVFDAETMEEIKGLEWRAWISGVAHEGLKPCPFCGGPVVRDYVIDEYNNDISCLNCERDFRMSDEEWNQRAPLNPTAAAPAEGVMPDAANT